MSRREALPTKRQEVLREALYWGKQRAIEVKCSPEYLGTATRDGNLYIWQSMVGANLDKWRARCVANGWGMAEMSEGWPAYVDAYWADFGDEGALADLAKWQAEAYPPPPELRQLSIGEEQLLAFWGLVHVDCGWQRSASWPYDCISPLEWWSSAPTLCHRLRNIRQLN